MSALGDETNEYPLIANTRYGIIAGSSATLPVLSSFLGALWSPARLTVGSAGSNCASGVSRHLQLEHAHHLVVLQLVHGRHEMRGRY